MSRWAELVGAATLLTRLPLGNLAAAHPPPADCVWAYPLVGAALGAAGAGVLAAMLASGMPQPLAAIWVLAALCLATGGLHEDGLADTADGFGGGRTRDAKLAIMRDSRIGSFGALALAFSLLLRSAALAVSPHPVRALVLASVFGRGAMLVCLLLLRPARADGLAAALGPARGTAFAGLCIAGLAAWWSPMAAAASLLASWAASVLAHRQIGGYTGDVLGAVEQAAECAALSASV